MVAFKTTLTILCALGVSGTSAASCSAAYAKCGSNADGVTCCTDNYYCQPWDAGFFQCMPQPAQCKQQLTNVDLPGNDIRTVYGIQPADCCSTCAQTKGCVAYTFVNSNPGQPACYLKSAVGGKTTVVGAVSGIVNGGTPPPSSSSPPPPPPSSSPPPPPPSSSPPPPPPSSSPPPSGCSAAPWSGCGSSSGSTCCPNGYYCQPWNPTYYQCIQPPARCPAQLTDMDFNGNDLATVYVSHPSLCCDACANTANCKAYTYINGNPGQPVCYLKSAAGTPTRLVGAVSGKLN